MVTLRIPMRALGKARPRVTRWGTYMPKSYTKWLEEFRTRAKEQYRGEVLTSPLILSCTFSSPSGKQRSDLDNCVGSVADAIQPWLIANDRQVMELHAWYVHGPLGILVQIEGKP
jgi:Holliday junction resolvase RusA-like endonuclease